MCRVDNCLKSFYDFWFVYLVYKEIPSGYSSGLNYETGECSARTSKAEKKALGCHMGCCVGWFASYRLLKSSSVVCWLKFSSW